MSAGSLFYSWRITFLCQLDHFFIAGGSLFYASWITFLWLEDHFFMAGGSLQDLGQLVRIQLY